MSPDLKLSLLGFGMIATFMTLIMTRAVSAIVALQLVPVLFGIFAGHGVDLARMALDGIARLTPTAIALVFAVLYFGLMIDAGLFDPLVLRVVKSVGGDPLRVAVGTAIVALVVSLDGDGATTVLVTVGAFLPIYTRLGMNRLIIAVILGLANPIINLLPWGGPTGRVAAALHLDMRDVFVPLLPTIGVGVIATLAVAWYLGVRERKRLGVVTIDSHAASELFERAPGVTRPNLFWLNLGLTLGILACAITGALPLPVVFMAGFTIALLLNYPKQNEQRERIAARAPNALPILLLIVAAGVFTGILSGTGMIDAMGRSLIALIPASIGPHFALVVAGVAAPLTFLMSNDAYYFGIVPLLSEAARAYGVAPVEVARASLLGATIHALSPLVAAVYLLIGLLKVEFGELQRFAWPFALIVYALLVLAAVTTGAIPWFPAP
jgi:CitMHS family citrate-Mg2+:H+ or citrate-Ca2+:H+ symporter